MLVDSQPEAKRGGRKESGVQRDGAVVLLKSLLAPRGEESLPQIKFIRVVLGFSSYKVVHKSVQISRTTCIYA